MTAVILGTVFLLERRRRGIRAGSCSVSRVQRGYRQRKVTHSHDGVGKLLVSGRWHSQSGPVFLESSRSQARTYWRFSRSMTTAYSRAATLGALTR
jgi:hypothetical protein